VSFRCTLRVRYAETDQMGIVYHANYFTWFEIARTEYMRSLGQSYRQIEELGIMLPVAEVSCRYLAPAHYDDELEIVIALTSIGAASLCFSYRVLRAADGVLLALGQTKQAFVGRNMHPLNCKRQFPELWAMLEQQLSDTANS